MKLFLTAMIVRMILMAFKKDKIEKEIFDTQTKADTRDPAAFSLR